MESAPKPTPEESLGQASYENPYYESGPAIAERRAQQTINQNEARKKQEASQERHEAAIEERVVSGDVQSLNDAAELEIYGSRDRTYEHQDIGNIDQNNPYKGILEQMREEPAKMQGRPQTERDKAAQEREEKSQKYEQELLGLVEHEGLELCQAKMVMDLTEKDRVAKEEFIKKLKEDGVTLRDKDGNIVTPEQKATERYEKLDEERIKLIRSEGAFTMDEYKRARRGESLYDGSQKQPENTDIPPEADDSGPQEPPAPQEPEQNNSNEQNGGKERTKEEILQDIREILGKLNEADNPGAADANMMKPIRKRDFSVSKKRLSIYPRLLDVRAPDSSMHTNLSGKLKGHLKTGEDIAWILPQIGGPRPDKKPTSKVITPDGRIFSSFTRVPDKLKTEAERRRDEDLLGIDLESFESINDLSEKDLAKVEASLLSNLENQAGPNDQEAQERPAGELTQERDEYEKKFREALNQVNSTQKGTPEYEEARERVNELAAHMQNLQQEINKQKSGDNEKGEDSDETQKMPTASQEETGTGESGDLPQYHEMPVDELTNIKRNYENRLQKINDYISSSSQEKMPEHDKAQIIRHVNDLEAHIYMIEQELEKRNSQP